MDISIIGRADNYDYDWSINFMNEQVMLIDVLLFNLDQFGLYNTRERI